MNSSVNKVYHKRPVIEDSVSSSGEEPEDFGSMESIFKQPDLILNICGRKMYIASEGFRKISSVFEKMVTCDFKEERNKEIYFEGKDYKTFVRFIRVAHPGIDDKFEDETIDQILPLIDEYLAEDARAEADNFLVDAKRKKIKTTTSEELVTEIFKADSYKLQKYLNLLVEEAARRRQNKLESQPCFDKINFETKYKILEKRSRAIDREVAKATKAVNQYNNQLGTEEKVKPTQRESASKFGEGFFKWMSDL